MKIEPEILSEYFKPVYIFGSKLKEEKEFFLQIVDNEKRKNRLESHFFGKGDEVTWFVQEFKLPLYCPAEIDNKPEEIKPEEVLKRLHEVSNSKPFTDNLFKPLPNAELF